jgi:hypothetical protein
LIKGTPTLFSPCFDEKAGRLAQHCYQEIKSKRKIDKPNTINDDFDLVNLKTLKNKNIREVGAEPPQGREGRHLLPAHIAQRERRTNTLDHLQRNKGNRIHVPGIKNRHGPAPNLP